MISHTMKMPIMFSQYKNFHIKAMPLFFSYNLIISIHLYAMHHNLINYQNSIIHNMFSQYMYYLLYSVLSSIFSKFRIHANWYSQYPILFLDLILLQLLHVLYSYIFQDQYTFIHQCLWYTWNPLCNILSKVLNSYNFSITELILLIL